jgi:hypothetical protein
MRDTIEHQTPDTTSIMAMLRELFAPYADMPTGQLEVTTIWPDKTAGKAPLARHITADEIPTAAGWLTDRNAEGWGLYVGAGLRQNAKARQRASKGDVVQTRWLWLDFDDEGSADKARDMLAATDFHPTFWVRTGSLPYERWHAWFELAEPMSGQEAEGLMARMIAALGADPAPKSRSGVMRLAGGIAWPKPEKAGRVAELVSRHAGSGRAYTKGEVAALVDFLDPPKVKAAPRASRGRAALASKASTAQIEELLRWIDPAPLQYDDWLRVGMALHDAGEPIETWEGWSARSPKHDDTDMQRRWDSFGRTSSGVTVATLHHMARAAGADLAEIARMGRPEAKQRPAEGLHGLPVTEARAQLDGVVQGFWGRRKAGATPRIEMVNATLGLGKTESTLKMIAEAIRERRQAGDEGAVVAIATPQHRLSDQMAADFERLAPDLTAAVLRGPEADDPNAPGQKVCKKLDTYREARALLRDPEAEVCRGCEHRLTCQVMTDRIAKADVYIVAHQALGGKTPVERRGPRVWWLREYLEVQDRKAAAMAQGKAEAKMERGQGYAEARGVRRKAKAKAVAAKQAAKAKVKEGTVAHLKSVGALAEERQAALAALSPPERKAKLKALAKERKEALAGLVGTERKKVMADFKARRSEALAGLVGTERKKVIADFKARRSEALAAFKEKREEMVGSFKAKRAEVLTERKSTREEILAEAAAAAAKHRAEGKERAEKMRAEARATARAMMAAHIQGAAQEIANEMEEVKSPREGQQGLFTVIDEDPLGALLFGTDMPRGMGLSAWQVAPDGDETELKEARAWLASVVQKNGVGPLRRESVMIRTSHRHLEQLGVTIGIDKAEAGAKLEWVRAQGKDKPKEMVQHNKTVRSTAAIWREVADFLRGGSEATGRLVVVADAEKGLVIQHCGLREVQAGWKEGGLLMLDATGQKELAEALLGEPVALHRVTADQPMLRVVQDASRAFGKSMLVASGRNEDADKAAKNNVAKLMKWVKARAAEVEPELFGVITYKAVVEAMQDSGLPDNVVVGHFGALRGMNSMAMVAGMAVVGRPMPEEHTLSRMTAALTGRAVEGRYDLAGETERLVRAAVGLWWRGSVAARHPDDMAQRLLESVRDAEVVQAVGRPRAVNRTAPVTVWVMSDAVLPFPVELAELWNEVGAQERGPLGRMLAAGGIAFTSGAAAASAYPEMWASKQAASYALTGQNFLYEETHIRNFDQSRAPTRLDYRVPRARSVSTAWVDTTRHPDPVAALLHVVPQAVDVVVVDAPTPAQEGHESAPMLHVVAHNESPNRPPRQPESWPMLPDMTPEGALAELRARHEAWRQTSGGRKVAHYDRWLRAKLVAAPA